MLLARGSSFMGHSHRVAMDRAKVRVTMPWAANGMKSQVRTKSNRFVSVLAKFDGTAWEGLFSAGNMDHPLMERS